MISLSSNEADSRFDLHSAREAQVEEIKAIFTLTQQSVVHEGRALHGTWASIPRLHSLQMKNGVEILIDHVIVTSEFLLNVTFWN